MSSAEEIPAACRVSDHTTFFRIKRKEALRVKAGGGGLKKSSICYNCLSFTNAELGIVRHPLLPGRSFCCAECLRATATQLFVDCCRCSKIVPYSAVVGIEQAYCSRGCLEAHAEELSFEHHEEEANLTSSEDQSLSEEAEDEADRDELIAALGETNPPRFF